MARKPKATAAKTDTIAGKLLAAMRFCEVASHDIGTPRETHLVIANHWAQAFDGIIAASYPIAEDITATPRTSLLIAALAKCGNNLSITQLDANRIAIKSDRFRAVVPCLDAALLPMTPPDPPCGAITDDFKLALEAVSVLASETADNLIAASILLRSCSVVASNRVVIFEAWHGIDMPNGLVLPKSAATAIVKNSGSLVSFGFSSNSVTFYFSNGAWIKSQLWTQSWGNQVDDVLNEQGNMQPLPNEFFNAVDAISAFAYDNHVYFHDKLLCAKSNTGDGAQYEIPELKAGPAFNWKYLKLIQPHAKFVDFNLDGKLKFQGDRVRGVMAGRVTYVPSGNTNENDPIPF